jgi:heat shock protein HtpX
MYLWKNRLKTVALLALLTALTLFIGGAVGGQIGLVVALLCAVALNFGACWFSDRIVLRMHGAREVTDREAPLLVSVTRGLATRAGLPMPRVFVIADDAPNAFATGRSPARAAIAVSEGLLRVLTREELRGVIAHELAHVRNRDTLVMTVVGGLAGALSMLANMAMFSSLFGGGEDEEEGSALGGLLWIAVAPFAAMLIQLAVSRSREFMADEEGARLCGDPLALAGALRKIEAWSRDTAPVTGAPATAHLMIVNPFSGGGIVRLFSTHPATEKRIERLESLASMARPFSFERAA